MTGWLRLWLRVPDAQGHIFGFKLLLYFMHLAQTFAFLSCSGKQESWLLVATRAPHLGPDSMSPGSVFKKNIKFLPFVLNSLASLASGTVISTEPLFMWKRKLEISSGRKGTLSRVTLCVASGKELAHWKALPKTQFPVIHSYQSYNLDCLSDKPGVYQNFYMITLHN